MPRDDAFSRADIDVGLFDDMKVKRLWRLLKDPAKMHHAMMLYVAAILASWADAEPMTLDDAAPLWTDVPEEIKVALNSVGLVDEDGRIPADSFGRWFGPAVERRSKRQAASATANAARWGTQSERSPNGVRPRSPTVPTDQHTAGAPATDGGGRPREDGETLKAYLARIGAPIPEVAKETTNGTAKRAEGRGNADGKSGSRPRRNRKAPVGRVRSRKVAPADDVPGGEGPQP